MPTKTDFLPPGSATIDDFAGSTCASAESPPSTTFPAARKPAYRLTIDFGPGGIKRSSAQLPPTYPDPSALVGRLVVAVVNFAPRNIAGFQSEVLVLGALPDDGLIPLLGVDERRIAGRSASADPATGPILPGSMHDFRLPVVARAVLVFAAQGPGEWPEGGGRPGSDRWSGNPAQSVSK